MLAFSHGCELGGFSLFFFRVSSKAKRPPPLLLHGPMSPVLGGRRGGRAERALLRSALPLTQGGFVWARCRGQDLEDLQGRMRPPGLGDLGRGSRSLARALTRPRGGELGMLLAGEAVLSSAKHSRPARKQLYGLCKTPLIFLCLLLA